MSTKYSGFLIQYISEIIYAFIAIFYFSVALNFGDAIQPQNEVFLRLTIISQNFQQNKFSSVVFRIRHFALRTPSMQETVRHALRN